MKTINVFAKWQVKEGELDQVLTLLGHAAEQTRTEEGNIFFKINQSTTDPNTLLLSEAYRDEAAVEAHRATDHFQNIVLAQVVPLLASREVILATELSL